MPRTKEIDHLLVPGHDLADKGGFSIVSHVAHLPHIPGKCEFVTRARRWGNSAALPHAGSGGTKTLLPRA